MDFPVDFDWHGRRRPYLLTYLLTYLLAYPLHGTKSFLRS